MESHGISRTPPRQGMRLGLALSGGGYRASFFHIGLLARLADLGLLRYVEVISTVSGGSIIGALYYLHLKKLFEAKSDQEITDLDYQQIVAQIAESFLAATQQNLIMRTYINPVRNLLMAIPKYSQSVRLGRLYDQVFYRPLLRPGSREPIKMRELIIKPLGERDNFLPLRDNGHRRAKVPILLINATSLNTGRAWRFEAASMGEYLRDSELAIEIDKNYRLLGPFPLANITRKHQDFELGQAISASACVPGIFNPLPIDNLYPEDIQLQLVDGGVTDNQGIQGLIDMDCSHLLISDATKQIDEEAQPSTQIRPMMERIRSILIDRIREEQLLSLLAQMDKAAIFVHPRRGLPVKIKPFLDSEGNPNRMEWELNRADYEHNGMSAQVQFLISRFRTHIDSFTEIEAYSIMSSAYFLSLPEFQSLPDLCTLSRESGNNGPNGVEWPFLKITPWMNRPTPLYLRHLTIARERFLKVFRLNRRLALIALLAFLGFFIAAYQVLQTLARYVGGRGLTISLDVNLNFPELINLIALCLVIFVVNQFSKVIPPLQRIREAIALFWNQSFLPIMVWPLICLHLFVFDPIFISLGRLQQLGAPPRPEQTPEHKP